MKNRWLGIALTVGMVIAACGGPSPEASGNAEGIQVHGDWVIDVYNADGTLDQHHEFSNALVSGGETVTRLLAKEISPKIWLVVLETIDGVSPCVVNDAESLCVVQEDHSSLTALPVEGDTPGLLDVLRLQGSFVADQDGDLQRVRASLQGCAFGTSSPPFSCAAVTFGEKATFSSTDLAAPVVVNAGQTIDVIVDFKFVTGT